MLTVKKRHRYWSLIKEIAITDFKLKYQGSVFGYLWSLAKPMAYFGVLYIVFTKVFKLGTTVPHYPIHLLLGVVIFGFWAEATSVAMSSIAYKGDLIRKVYFPRIVLVISSTLTSLFVFTLNLLAVYIFSIFSGLSLSLNSVAIFLLILELYIFVLGVSFYLAALFVKFKDVGHIWEVFNQILFYATPIIYPLKLVPARLAKFQVLSPLTQIIQDVRKVVLGFDPLTTSSYWSFYFIPFIIVILIFVSGYLIFQKMAAKFAEEV